MFKLDATLITASRGYSASQCVGWDVISVMQSPLGSSTALQHIARSISGPMSG